MTLYMPLIRTMPESGNRLEFKSALMSLVEPCYICQNDCLPYGVTRVNGSWFSVCAGCSGHVRTVDLMLRLVAERIIVPRPE